MTPFPAFSSRLEGVRQTRHGWVAKCPAHEDNRPSMSFWVNQETGDLLVKCFRGCTFDEIISAVGLEKEALLSERRNKTMKEVATYPYHDMDGTLLYEVVRFDPKDFRCRRTVRGQYEWGLGDTPRVLYRLPQLVAEQDRVVLVVEGEKSADLLVNSGLLATCSPGGAGKWRNEYGLSLRGRRVVILPDNDEPGVDHALSVYQGLKPFCAVVAIAHLEGPPKSDVVDWLAAGHTIEELKTICLDALKAEKIIDDLKQLSPTDRWRALDQLLSTIRTASP